MNGHESNENDRKNHVVSIKGFDHSLHRLHSCHLFEICSI